VNIPLAARRLSERKTAAPGGDAAVLIQRRNLREEKAPARLNPALRPVFFAAISGRRYRRFDQIRSREVEMDLIFVNPDQRAG